MCLLNRKWDRTIEWQLPKALGFVLQHCRYISTFHDFLPLEIPNGHLTVDLIDRWATALGVSRCCEGCFNLPISLGFKYSEHFQIQMNNQSGQESQLILISIYFYYTSCENMPNLVSNDPCDCRKYHDSGELAVTFPDFKRWQGTDSEASSMEACGPGSTWTTRAATSVGDRTLSDSSESGTQRAAATCNSPNSQRTEVDGERKAISSTAWHCGSELIEIKSWEFEDLNCKHLRCILLNDDLSNNLLSQSISVLSCFLLKFYLQRSPSYAGWHLASE